MLADEDLNSIPDRRITLMGQQQEIKEGSFLDATQSDKLLLKNEEIERLTDQLAQEKEKHEETRK